MSCIVAFLNNLGTNERSQLQSAPLKLNQQPGAGQGQPALRPEGQTPGLGGQRAFGSRRREWSEERLKCPGAEACASLGSAGLLSARAFPPTGALNVGYLIYTRARVSGGIPIS